MSGRGAQFGYVETLRSKRYRARYVGPDGERYSGPVTYATKADARDFLAREAADIARGVWRPPAQREVEVWQDTAAGPLFAQFAEKYVANREVTERTASEYRRLLAKRINPTFGTKRVSEITTNDVDDWFAGRTLRAAPTERARAYELLAAVLKHAVRRGVIPSSPAMVEGGAKSPAAKVRRIATTAEVEHLHKAMPPHTAVAVILGSWCALRLGEIRELRRGDFDLARRTVTVARAVSHSDSEAFIIGTPKSAAGVRTVAIPAHVLPLVEAHLDEWVDDDPDALVLHAVNNPTRHLAYATFHRGWDAARVEAGRPDLRFHDLRHTGLTWTARTGATLAEIMARGGHSSVTAALRYQAASQDRDRAVADALSTMNLD